MSTIKDRQKNAEQEVLEQQLIEDKLAARTKKAEKTLPVDKKKGNKVTFKPARRLPALEAPPGFRIAWKHNTPENIRKCQIEGWIPANRIDHKIDVEMGDYYRKLNDSPIAKAQSSVIHNELVAMLLPEEMAIAREEYHRQETETQTRSKLRPEDSGSALSKAAKIKTTIEIN